MSRKLQDREVETGWDPTVSEKGPFTQARWVREGGPEQFTG